MIYLWNLPGLFVGFVLQFVGVLRIFIQTKRSID
jgi:hypothetical protein